MARYTYLVADLRTNAILAELPLREVSFSQDLNSAGSFHGILPLGDPRLASLDPAGSTQPGRTALYVDRDGALVWGGIIWTRRYTVHRGRGHELASKTSSDVSGGHVRSHAFELEGTEFFSYFGRRLISDSLAYSNTDPLVIVRNLLTYAAGKTGGDIGINLDSTLSGLSITRTYDGFAMTPIDQAINLLSSETPGFDFGIDCQYDANGTPQKYLHLGYPRRGQIAAQTGHVFDFPGNISDYVWPEDATSMAVTIINTGAGNNVSQLQSTASAPGLLDAGYPLLESTRAYADVSLQATLDSRTQAELLIRDNPVVIPELQVRADREPFLGSYITGDDVRVRIAGDPRFPSKSDGSPGLDSFYRLTGITVRPPDIFPEMVTLRVVPL